MTKKLVPPSITTKTGDKGMSGLANGKRLSKSDPLFEVLGTQDELNAWLGVVSTHLPDSYSEQKTMLTTIQEALFYLGAEVAQSPTTKFSEKYLTELENAATELQARMSKNWTNKFLFPGGTQLAVWTDVARTIARRLERVIVSFNESSKSDKINPNILKYVNRLSDYLFLLRCYANYVAEYPETKFISDFFKK